MMIDTKPGDRAFEEIRPWCVSANDLINPLPPSLFYGSGWLPFHPPAGTRQRLFPFSVADRIEGVPGQGHALLTPSAHYYYSMRPTSKLRVPLQVGAGDIGVYYLKESVKDVGEGSAVECWVDDNYQGAVTLENGSADLDKGASREMCVGTTAFPLFFIIVNCRIRQAGDDRLSRFKRLALCRVPTARRGGAGRSAVQDYRCVHNVATGFGVLVGMLSFFDMVPLLAFGTFGGENNS